MSDSLRPHGLWLARLLCPWDSLGKNTGVGGHFLLQCMKVKSESEVAQSCPTLSNPAAHQAPPSTGFFRQEYWNGMPLPSPTYMYIIIIPITVFMSWYEVVHVLYYALISQIPLGATCNTWNMSFITFLKRQRF